MTDPRSTPSIPVAPPSLLLDDGRLAHANLMNGRCRCGADWPVESGWKGYAFHLDNDVLLMQRPAICGAEEGGWTCNLSAGHDGPHNKWREARPTPVEPEAPIDHLRYHREEPCDCEPPGDWLDAREAPQRGPVISVTHSCGDCGFLGQEPDFDRHHSRVWHRGVKKIGLEAALDSRLVNSPDARRAIAIFREGARP